MFIKRDSPDPKPVKAEKPRYRKIRKVSKKLSREQAIYRKVRKIHLEENPNCKRCGGVATDLHHKRGRIGSLLTDMRYFVSLCRGCHSWVETHPYEAIELGLSDYRTHEHSGNL